MKKIVVMLVLVVLLCSALSGVVLAQGPTVAENLDLLGKRASEVAMNRLSFTKGDSNVLAMTNAGYSIIDGHTTEKCIDGITNTSGCTIGKGTLLLIHRSKGKLLGFAFFKKDTKECVYLEVDNEVLSKTITEVQALSEGEVFTNIKKENIGADRLLNQPNLWQEKMVAKVFGENEFSIITIANVWAKGSPHDFMQMAQFHNHICPGLISGYLIIKYLDKNLPIQDPGQQYQIIAVPLWCKDDAEQVLTDATVGHKQMAVMALTKDQVKQLPKEAKNVAGLYIRWDRKAGAGDGLVLAFDWDKASQMCGVDRKDFRDFKTYKWWWTRLKMDLWMMDYLDKPETFVKTIKEFDVKSPGELLKLKSAGVNPLAELGIMPKKEVIPVWMYVIVGILAIIAIGAVVYAVKVKRG